MIPILWTGDNGYEGIGVFGFVVWGWVGFFLSRGGGRNRRCALRCT